MATAQTTQAKAEPVAPAVAATPAVAAAPVFKKETITLSEDMTIEQLQELMKNLEDRKTAKIKVERDPALVAVKAQIAKFSFTAAELGIKVGTATSEVKAETPAKVTREMTKNLKSPDGTREGIWLNHMPEAIAGVEAVYTAGKSVDEYLKDPSEKKGKMKFLFKLEQKFNKAPNEVQLGGITTTDYEASKPAKA